MAARALWKGSLKLSLVAIPIRVFPATDPSSEIAFRQIHAKCGTPIQLKKWCPHCDVEVGRDEIAKGYEVQPGEFVIVDQKDIDAVRPVSTHTIEIAQVVNRDQVDPIYIEKPYYVAPDSQSAGAAFAVVRDALGDRAGVGKLALHGREYLVALSARERALLMFTLRHGAEVRAMDGIEELQFAKGTAKPAEVKLARQILTSFENARDLSEYHDDYEDALRQMIEAKAHGKRIVAPKAERPPKVVNLMDALRRSLDRIGTGRKTTTRAAARGRTKARRAS